MFASRKKSSRTRTAKEETDPLPTDDPASCPTRINYYQVFMTHPDVVEELVTTLHAYLHDLAVSDTLLVRLATAQSREGQTMYSRRMAANVQARTAQLVTLRTLLAFLADPQAQGEDEPPVSIH